MIKIIGSDIQQVLKEATDKKVITPLKLTYDQLPEGEKVQIAKPDTGSFTTYTVGPYKEDRTSFSLIAPEVKRDEKGTYYADLLCKGRSGDAIVSVGTDGKILPRIYGLVSYGINSVPITRPNGKVEQCSPLVIASALKQPKQY